MRFRYKVFIDESERKKTLNLNILAIYSEFQLLIELH